MEGLPTQLWILTLLVAGATQGQKVFNRACDCEYTQDGKCAYTLLLPRQGQGVCPQNGGSAEMSAETERMVMDLRANYTKLIEMYSSQATMLNQVYGVLMDKLITCPLLMQCAVTVPPVEIPEVNITFPTVPNITTPTMPNFTMPDIEVPTGTPPDISIPDFTTPDITPPDLEIDLTTPQINVPTVEVPRLGCTDLCPDLDGNISDIRSLITRVNVSAQVSAEATAQIRSAITQLNNTIIELAVMVLTNQQQGNGQGEGGGGMTGPIPGVPPIQVPPVQVPSGQGLEGAVTLLQRVLSAGALCLRKGPLVVSLPDTNIDASSEFNFQHVASRGRILTEQDGDLMGAWCPGEPNTPGQEWIQFDLGRVVVVYGIVTRGRSDYAQWVTSYMVHYASELNPLAPALTTWTPVTDMLDIDTVIFEGNSDQNTPQFRYFDNPVQARYVRIIPLSANEDQNMCMRADVIGCVDEPTLGNI